MPTNNRMFFRGTAFLALATAVLLAAPLSADSILYSDTFTRGNGTTPLALNGSAPETRVGQYGAQAAAAWIANPAWITNGSAAYGDTPFNLNYGMSASLPFKPEAGHVYTFSATLNCPELRPGGTLDDWVSMGFTQNSHAGDASFMNLTSYGWALARYSTALHPNQGITGPGSHGAAGIGSEMGTVHMTLVLDTNPTLWTVEWLVNGFSRRGPSTLGLFNPNIQFISIGVCPKSKGIVDNLQLSVNAELVPEPSMLALLGGGLLGLLAYAWRKRK